MRRHAIPIIATSLASLIVLSCQQAERLPSPPADPPTPTLVGEETGDAPDSAGFGVVPITISQRESLMFIGDSLPAVTITMIPGPEVVIERLLSAYNGRDAAAFASLLAEDYVCTEITTSGMRSWGKPDEILIHERMFDPSYGIKPIANILLSLEDVTAVPVDLAVFESEVWKLTCAAHLVLEYANPGDGAFEFLGPAEFHVRRNLALRWGWQILEWHDRPPEGRR